MPTLRLTLVRKHNMAEEISLTKYIADINAAQIRRQQKEAAGEPCVGIFWYFPGDKVGEEPTLFTDIYPVSEVRSLWQGVFLDPPTNHLNMWKTILKFKPGYKGLDHQYFPRGRVVCRVENGMRSYDLIVDPQIKARPNLVMALIDEFNLPENATKIVTDDHYMAPCLLDAGPQFPDDC